MVKGKVKMLALFAVVMIVSTGVAVAAEYVSNLPQTEMQQVKAFVTAERGTSQGYEIPWDTGWSGTNYRSVCTLQFDNEQTLQYVTLKGIKSQSQSSLTVYIENADPLRDRFVGINCIGVRNV